MTTPIADMVAEMLAKNTPAEAIVIAIRALELVSASVRGQSADRTDDRRERDRLRKQEKRAKLRSLKPLPEANDAGNRSQNLRGLSADTADKCCDLLTSLSSSESPSGIQEVKKKKRTELVEGRRGTRMSADAVMPDESRQYAIANGLSPNEVWPEFVDFWVGVPGERGVKLNWPATFRNRVRDILKRNGVKNGKSIPAASDRPLTFSEIARGVHR